MLMVWTLAFVSFGGVSQEVTDEWIATKTLEARAQARAFDFGAAWTTIEGVLVHVDEAPTQVAIAANLVAARIALDRGEHERCQELIQIARASSATDRTVEQDVELALLEGRALVLKGATPEAIDSFFAVRSRAEQLDLIELHIESLLELAYVCVRQFDHAATGVLLDEAEELIAGGAAERWSPQARHLRGVAAAYDDDLAGGRVLLQQSIEWAREFDRLDVEAESRKLLGVFDANADRIDSAYAQLGQSLEIATRMGDWDLMLNTSIGLARARLEGDDPSGAVAVLEAVTGLQESVAQPRVRAHFHRYLGLALDRLGEHERAYDAMFVTADTERWLAPLEASAQAVRHDLQWRNEQLAAEGRRRVILWSSAALAAMLLAGVLYRMHRRQVEINARLSQALSQVKQLHGLLPICSFCKAVRDDEGYWQQIEQYILDHSDAGVTHSFCPSCVKEHYGDVLVPREPVAPRSPEPPPAAAPSSGKGAAAERQP